jgi:NADPH:quinone reductase-like Zn-dependent oxidoreductase
LVHGAAGGVGVFAVQLARWRGATVIGTVSAHNAAFARGLAADEVIDYRAVRFEDIARGIDLAIFSRFALQPLGAALLDGAARCLARLG